MITKKLLAGVGLAGILAIGAITTTTKTITTVKWDVPQVRIALIQKTNDNPNTYRLVRVLATSTPNLGTFKWTKIASDKGSNLYIEIECIMSDAQCRAPLPIGPYTVK